MRKEALLQSIQDNELIIMKAEANLQMIEEMLMSGKLSKKRIVELEGMKYVCHNSIIRAKNLNDLRRRQLRRMEQGGE